MCVATMRSITVALRAQKILRQQGIYSEIVNVDGNLTKYGCTYGLAFSCAHTETARRLFAAQRIDFGEMVGEDIL